MNWLKTAAQQIRHYPSAVVGSIIILILMIAAIITPIVIPYSEAVFMWRGEEITWRESPRTAWPVWYNWFRSTKLPTTIALNSREGEGQKTLETISDTTREALFNYEFEFTADEFPVELVLFSEAQFTSKEPHVVVTWYTPDGRDIRISEFSSGASQSFRFAQDDRLQRRLERSSDVEGITIPQALFDDPNQEGLQVQKGTYRVEVSALLFEPEADIETIFVSYGLVHGWAGTDHMRRDLSLALLWGIPIAMAFGLVAAVGTTILTMSIAAVGVWFGGWIDSTIQRVTEVNSIIPLLPILIMVGTFYSKSIWIMLGLVVVFSIFGLGIKNYRAIFLQVRELPYIDAARAYGASNFRIIFRYLIPRVLPLVIPQLVTLVPGFVFIEASLAVLGLGDPILPTWGKVIENANRQGALYNGYYYWILEPATLLMVAGLSFAMVGFALDRVFNPKLREV